MKSLLCPLGYRFEIGSPGPKYRPGDPIQNLPRWPVSAVPTSWIYKEVTHTVNLNIVYDPPLDYINHLMCRWISYYLTLMTIRWTELLFISRLLKIMWVASTLKFCTIIKTFRFKCRLRLGADQFKPKFKNVVSCVINTSVNE